MDVQSLQVTIGVTIGVTHSVSQSIDLAYNILNTFFICDPV